MLTTEKYVFRSVGQNRIGCNSDDLEILAGPKFISQGGYGNSYGRSEEADYISLGPIWTQKRRPTKRGNTEHVVGRANHDDHSMTIRIKYTDTAAVDVINRGGWR
jgi:hypothetical protein